MRYAVFSVSVITVVTLSCGSPEAELVVTETPTLTAAGHRAEVATAMPEPTPDPFASNRISCTEEVMADRETHLVVLKGVKKRYSGAFWSIPGVVGVGIGVLRVPPVKSDVLGINVAFDYKTFQSAFNPRSMVQPPVESEDDPRGRIPPFLEGCSIYPLIINLESVLGPQYLAGYDKAVSDAAKGAACFGHVDEGEPCACTRELAKDRLKMLNVLEVVESRHERRLGATVPGLAAVLNDHDREPPGIRVVTREEESLGLIPDYLEGCPVRGSIGDIVLDVEQ